MPTVNLPLGSYGIFVPAQDIYFATVSGDGGGALMASEKKETKKETKEPKESKNKDARETPQEEPQEPHPHEQLLDGYAELNLTRFLQQFAPARSPNAALGGPFGANELTGFDVVYTGSGNVELNLYEFEYRHGEYPHVRFKNNTRQFRLIPDDLPPPEPHGTSIAHIRLEDYWLIGQNRPNVETILTFNGSGPTIVGVTIYFGDLGEHHHGRGDLP